MSSREENLVIHLGGLGDVCLSESVFLSLRRHFGATVRAVGNKRVLDQFCDYFIGVESIDEKSWLYLFADGHEGPRWQQIVLVAKDRTGSFRERLGRLSQELIFVDMYPDDGATHVSEYQLEQIARYGLNPSTAAVPRVSGGRVMLYPEKPFRKRKWPVELFAEVYRELKDRGVDAVLMGHPDLRLPASDTVSFGHLHDVARFFSGGGFFFSNDSGMAHFAAKCGLRTLTLFWEADPVVWHPVGGLALFCQGPGPTVEEVVELILRVTGDSARAPESQPR